MAGRGWGVVFRPLRPYPSRSWGLRPQTPAVALNALVLKRRTGLKPGVARKHGTGRGGGGEKPSPRLQL